MKIDLKSIDIDLVTKVTVAELTGPPVDVYETEDFLIIDIDLPGIKPDKVLIKVFGEILIIEGIRERLPGDDIKYLCMERSRGAFRRIIRLPVEVESDRGEALYKRGVITICFPKTKPKVVKIKLSK